MYYFNHQRKSGLSNRNQKYELMNNEQTPICSQKTTASFRDHYQTAAYYQISHVRYVDEKQFLFTDKCNGPAFTGIHSISNKPLLGFKIKQEENYLGILKIQYSQSGKSKHAATEGYET